MQNPVGCISWTDETLTTRPQRCSCIRGNALCAQKERSLEVDSHDLVVHRLVKAEGVLTRLDSGIVDEDIDRSVFGLHPVEHPVDGVDGRDVGLDGERRTALLLDLPAHFRGGVRIVYEVDRDASTGTGQLARNGRADSSTSAGDQGRFLRRHAFFLVWYATAIRQASFRVFLLCRRCGSTALTMLCHRCGSTAPKNTALKIAAAIVDLLGGEAGVDPLLKLVFVILDRFGTGQYGFYVLPRHDESAVDIGEDQIAGLDNNPADDDRNLVSRDFIARQRTVGRSVSVPRGEFLIEDVPGVADTSIYDNPCAPPLFLEARVMTPPQCEAMS